MGANRYLSSEKSVLPLGRVNPVRALTETLAFRFILLIVIQIAVAWSMKEWRVVSTIGAIVALLAGIYCVLRDDQPQRLIYVTAYITGSEVLWRMTGAGVFWEYGKYAVCLLFILAVFRYRLFAKSARWPIFYFLLLLPAILLMPTFNRETLALNLSGPLSLAIASIFFSTQVFTRLQTRNLLLSTILPILGVGFLATYSMITAEGLYFSSESNRISSGGFGPNQVSSILGLGAFLIFLLVISGLIRGPFLLILIPLGVWLLVQCSLTFSRGGFVTAVGASFVAMYYFSRDYRSRRVIVLLLISLFILMYIWLIPTLQQLTDYKLIERFTDPYATGREQIARADLLAFRKNPFLGVGIGQSFYWHEIYFRLSNAHTEYTRLLAEHGSLGLISLIILLVVIIRRVLSNKPAYSKAFVVSLTAFALLYMFHAAMRLVAPGFTFGLAEADFLPEDSRNDKPL